MFGSRQQFHPAFARRPFAPTIKIWSGTYRDAPDSGSDERVEHDEHITQVSIASDRTAVRVFLKHTEPPKIHPDQTARVYQISVEGRDLWGATGPGFEAFYTLYEFPAAAAKYCADRISPRGGTLAPDI